METLRDYVNWGLTHCDKTASAEGVPLVMENCKLNKKMKQLEMYGNSVQNGTPSPEAPVEVESVGEKTDNLFDPNVPNQHGFIHSDGTIHASSSFPHIMVYTFEVKPNTDYVYLCGLTKNPTYALYDEEMTFIKSGGLVSTSGGPIKFSTTADSAYVKLCVNQNRVDRGEQYFNEGTVPTQEPYGKYKIPVTVRGKNVADIDKGISTSLIANGDGTYTITKNGSYRISNLINIDIPIGTKFGISADIIDSSTSMRITAYDGVSGAAHYYRVNTNTVYTAEDPIGNCRIYIESSDPDGSYVTFKNFMVNIIPENDGYEPYVEPVTTNVYLNEPLRKIGDYADYIDFKAKKVVRKCVKKYLKDYEWGTSSVNVDGGYVFVVRDAEILPNSSNFSNSLGIALSNVFLSRYGFEGPSLDTIHMWNWYSNVRVVIKKSRLDDEGITFEEWLNRHNPYMIRIRVTETEEPITCELPTLPAKTSIVEIDTNLLPSNIKGKYIKR